MRNIYFVSNNANTKRKCTIIDNNATNYVTIETGRHLSNVLFYSTSLDNGHRALGHRDYELDLMHSIARGIKTGTPYRTG